MDSDVLGFLESPATIVASTYSHAPWFGLLTGIGITAVVLITIRVLRFSISKRRSATITSTRFYQDSSDALRSYDGS